MLRDRCKELCRARERNERAIALMYLLMLLGSTVFTDKMTQKVKLKYASLIVDLDHVAEYAWGAGVLALTYRYLGQASRSRGDGIAGCPLLVKSWIWAYFHGLRRHAQPSVTDMMEARAARRDGREAPHPPCRDALVEMRRVLDAMPYELRGCLGVIWISKAPCIPRLDTESSLSVSMCWRLTCPTVSSSSSVTVRAFQTTH